MWEMLVRRKTDWNWDQIFIVSGSEYLHDNLIIHHDLKPQNLFITDKMEIQIGDLGISAMLRFDGEQR